jgi:pimeloyl-ACP methyl ester carboxylesterase
MTEIRERFIRTNGVKLHVKEAGPEDGPMILFLHGFPEFWYAWRKQIGYFAEKGYLAVAPDQRGYNLSDKPKGIEAYKLDELAKDAVGLIDAYRRDKIFLVGHDWGASVSWWTALKYPERLKKLVIMNVPHPKVMGTNLLRNPKQIQKSWYIFFFQLPMAAEKLAESNNYEWPLDMIRESSRPGAFTPEELEKYREAFAKPGAFSAMVNWYRASLQARNEIPESFQVRVPMLLLWGVNDTALLDEMADQSMKYCPEGRLLKFDQASHWIQHEEAGTINPMLDDFFRKD